MKPWRAGWEKNRVSDRIFTIFSCPGFWFKVEKKSWFR